MRANGKQSQADPSSRHWGDPGGPDQGGCATPGCQMRPGGAKKTEGDTRVICCLMRELQHSAVRVQRNEQEHKCEERNRCTYEAARNGGKGEGETRRPVKPVCAQPGLATIGPRACSPLTTESPTTHNCPTPSQQTRPSSRCRSVLHDSCECQSAGSALRLTARAPSVPVRAYARSARRPAPAWYW